MDQHQAGVDSATEVDRHFERYGFSAVHPGTRSSITSAGFRPCSTKKRAAVTVHLRASAAQRGERWLCCGMALITAGSKAEYRLRPEAAHPENHGPRPTWVQERPIPRKRTTAFAPRQPRSYRQHGALEYKSANRKQACALCLQRPSPPLCAIVAIDAAREAPMTLPLRHGTLPARYRANEEKDHGLRKAFLKAPATQKPHEASALKKIPAPAHRQAAS